MNSRRGFLKIWIGQNEKSSAETNIREKIPLNRLKELPVPIVEQIEPVFFPDSDWTIDEKSIIFPNHANENVNNTYVFKDIEYEIFKFLQEGKRLQYISQIIAENHNLAYSVSYKKVSSLFFYLASRRVCHPKEAHHIGEFIKTKNNT
jgi:hypothetical protein